MTAAVSQSGTETPSLTWRFHPKQREFFENPARFRVAAWGRRTGKNIVANADQIDYALNPDRSEWGRDNHVTCWWIGPTYDQAKKYGFNTARSMLPSRLVKKVVRSEPYEIHIENGPITATIEYRTFDKPDSLDGAGVDHLVIDERALMPSLIWDETLRPMLSDNLGCAVEISKPKGKNQFHDHYTRGESNEWPEWWSSHATSYDNPFIAESEIDAAARELPEHVFQQEYLAVFLDDSGGVFKRVRDRAVSLYDVDERRGNGPYVHGWDFARHQNWTVGITLDRDGVLVNFERLQPPTWNALLNLMQRVYREYPGVVRVDASRDNKLVSDLEDAGVPVDAVSFSPQRKRQLIENLAARLEAGELTIPDIPVLVNELEIYEYDTTASGNVRYHAPSGWHDDCVDAFALAADVDVQRTRATWGTT